MEGAEQEGVLSAVPIPAAADPAESEGGAENVSPLNLASSLKDRFTLTRSQSSGMLNKLKNCVGVTSIQGRRPVAAPVGGTPVHVVCAGNGGCTQDCPAPLPFPLLN